MKNEQMTFPVVRGTEHWPLPLFDMPHNHTQLSPEEAKHLARLRTLAKERDFCFNYGTQFVAPTGGSK